MGWFNDLINPVGTLLGHSDTSLGSQLLVPGGIEGEGGATPESVAKHAGNFINAEGFMPAKEAQWLGNVVTGKTPLNHAFGEHNAIHANATEEINPNNRLAQNPDATAALVFAAIAGGGALAGGEGAGEGVGTGGALDAGSLTAEDSLLAPGVGGAGEAFTTGAEITADDVAAFQGLGATGADLSGAATAGLSDAGLEASPGFFDAGSFSVPNAEVDQSLSALPDFNVASPESFSSLNSASPLGAGSGDLTASDMSLTAPSEGGASSELGGDAVKKAAEGNTVSSALKQLGGYGKNALTGLSLLNSLRAQNAMKKNGADAAGQYNSIAKPTLDVSNQLLTNFKNGQISAADQQAIAQWQQQQMAQTNQYYAKAGLSNSSMHSDAVSKIAQQADSMRQQAVQNLLTGGLKAAGLAQGPQLAAVNASLQSDQAAQQATQNFLMQLAKMTASAPDTKKTT